MSQNSLCLFLTEAENKKYASTSEEEETRSREREREMQKKEKKERERERENSEKNITDRLIERKREMLFQ